MLRVRGIWPSKQFGKTEDNSSLVRLAQIVSDGCRDEESIGIDPVMKIREREDRLRSNLRR